MTKSLLQLFALSALFMKKLNCKIWRWPTLGSTFARKGKPGKNQVSGSFASWKMKISVSCRGNIWPIWGGKQHTLTSQLGATNCQVHSGHCVHTGMLRVLCVTFWFADSAAGTLICTRNITGSCQFSLCGARSLGSPSCSAEWFMLCLVALPGHSVISQLAECSYK